MDMHKLQYQFVMTLYLIASRQLVLVNVMKEMFMEQ